MAEEQDNSQRTEEPTQKRIEDAIKKGNVAYSREVTSFIILCLFTVFIIFILPGLLKKSAMSLSVYITDGSSFTRDYEGEDIYKIALKIALELLLFIAAPFMLATLGAIMGSVLQNGFLNSPEAIMPKLSKISPIAGFKRIFSLKSLVEFIKGIIKISVIGCTAYYAVHTEIQVIHVLHDASIIVIMNVLFNIATKMMIAICILQGIIAVLDYFYERFNYLKNLRMSKQEVKDELKQSEGDPEIKAKVRAIRFQRARRRIAAAVPKADVLITNPTHFAVALQYDPDSMQAPKLIAKGQDIVAQRMREIAKESNIPIVENPPLARSIYDNVDWDEFIQEDHYKAVAQIMTKLKKFAKSKAKPRS